MLPIRGRAYARELGLPADYPKDPADRIIGATALVEGMSLLTADREIRKAPGGSNNLVSSYSTVTDFARFLG